MNYGILLIIIGVAIALLAYPKFRRPIVSRLFNEGLVTPKIVAPEKAEVIKFAGADMSLFAIGFALMLIGLIILLNS